jgi:hypothetical protein
LADSHRLAAGGRFIRPQARHVLLAAAKKKGAHGGNMVSPVFLQMEGSVG